MLYDIVNLSDPYSIHVPDRPDGTPDLALAGVACLLLGGGQYAFRGLTGDTEVPMFMFGGVEAWFQQHCGAPPAAVVETVTKKRAGELAAVFDSVVYGPDRTKFEIARQFVPPERFIEFRDAWQGQQSSLNDIGGRAYAMAAALRAGKFKLVPAPAQVFKG